MRKLELICGGIALLSLIGGFMDVPLSGVFLLLSMSILAMLYYPLGALLFNGIRMREALNGKSFQAVPKGHLALGFVGGFILCPMMLGVIFKWNMWPGADMMLRVALGLAIIFLLIVMAMAKGRLEDFHRRIFVRFAIAGTLAALFSLLSTLHIVELRYRDQPELVQAWEAHLANPDNEALREELDALLRQDIKNQKRDEDTL